MLDSKDFRLLVGLYGNALRLGFRFREFYIQAELKLNVGLKGLSTACGTLW